MTKRRRVIIESPYAGDVTRNETYLASAIGDSLARGEAPFASHGFYTRFLNDAVPEQRADGMACGFAWGEVADLVAVYSDYGVSRGMEEGIALARRRGIPVKYRYIKPWEGQGQRAADDDVLALAAFARSTADPAVLPDDVAARLYAAGLISVRHCPDDGPIVTLTDMGKAAIAETGSA